MRNIILDTSNTVILTKVNKINPGRKARVKEFDPLHGVKVRAIEIFETLKGMYSYDVRTFQKSYRIWSAREQYEANKVAESVETLNHFLKINEGQLNLDEESLIHTLLIGLELIRDKVR